MAAVNFIVSLTLLYIIKIQMIQSQAIAGCNGGCPGYGICGGFYPTLVDPIDNDPLDIILPVLLLAICNRAGSNGPAPVNAFNLGMSEAVVAPPNGCYGGCCGGCNGGCGGTCNGCCNGNGCASSIVAERSTGLSNSCCGSCGCC